ncbi:hypothetical protein LOK49_LG03G01248 [Camellia lanceoleosa]|uniref:Uncharacterized protein n=1 Tax=Camellia lanceoleosa TaxID=1840588 RepID=A0ACC0I8L5_9ERIC|nr:hypothetical protein LOK49_LG03G01248 [Camellia lanceoleosa]
MLPRGLQVHKTRRIQKAMENAFFFFFFFFLLVSGKLKTQSILASWSFSRVNCRSIADLVNPCINFTERSLEVNL